MWSKRGYHLYYHNLEVMLYHRHQKEDVFIPMFVFWRGRSTMEHQKTHSHTTFTWLQQKLHFFIWQSRSCFHEPTEWINTLRWKAMVLTISCKNTGDSGIIHLVWGVFILKRFVHYVEHKSWCCQKLTKKFSTAVRIWSTASPRTGFFFFFSFLFLLRKLLSTL